MNLVKNISKKLLAVILAVCLGAGAVAGAAVYTHKSTDLFLFSKASKVKRVISKMKNFDNCKLTFNVDMRAKSEIEGQSSSVDINMGSDAYFDRINRIIKVDNPKCNSMVSDGEDITSQVQDAIKANKIQVYLTEKDSNIGVYISDNDEWAKLERDLSKVVNIENLMKTVTEKLKEKKSDFENIKCEKVNKSGKRYLRLTATTDTKELVRKQVELSKEICKDVSKIIGEIAGYDTTLIESIADIAGNYLENNDAFFDSLKPIDYEVMVDRKTYYVDSMMVDCTAFYQSFMQAIPNLFKDLVPSLMGGYADILGDSVTDDYYDNAFDSMNLEINAFKTTVNFSDYNKSELSIPKQAKNGQEITADDLDF